MKRTEEIHRVIVAPNSACKALGLLLVFCSILCFGDRCEAAQKAYTTLSTVSWTPTTLAASKFSFLDDILGGAGRSGGRTYGYSYQGAEREERRGEKGFFYYVFQTILRLISGVFLAFHAGTLIEKINRKNSGLDTAVAIGGFIFSLIFPWGGLVIGGACWGLWKLADDSARTPPTSDQ